MFAYLSTPVEDHLRPNLRHLIVYLRYMYVPRMLGGMLFLSHLILPTHKTTLSRTLLFRLLDMSARQGWLIIDYLPQPPRCWWGCLLYGLESGRTRPISLVSSDSLPIFLVGCQEAPRQYLTHFGATYPLAIQPMVSEWGSRSSSQLRGINHPGQRLQARIGTRALRELGNGRCAR